MFISALIISGTIGSIVLWTCRCLDAVLKIKSLSLCERMRQFIATAILTLIGIHVEVQGSLNAVESLKCVILTFSHASNFDGFLICSTWPIRLLAFAKKELFMVPFFSWISLAMGGIPVDRQNRDKAVRTLKRAVDSARNSNIGFVIATEGTRSSTGHLQQFKKGAFYMWEDLRSAVMPVIFLVVMIYGQENIGSTVQDTSSCVILTPFIPMIPFLARKCLPWSVVVCWNRS
jgi:1-acyl-sn-glycerol-3-phosphate acyltransferase